MDLSLLIGLHVIVVWDKLSRALARSHTHSCSHVQWTELQSLLKDLADHHGHTEYTPADEDIKWVIKHATKGTDKDGHRWSE